MLYIYHTQHKFILDLIISDINYVKFDYIQCKDRYLTILSVNSTTVNVRKYPYCIVIVVVI